MIMKITGAAVLIVSSGLYGIYSGQKLEKGLEQAKDLRGGLNVLKSDIYLNSLHIGKALENTASFMTTDLKNVFIECSRGIALQNGTSLQEYCTSCLCDKKVLLDKECKSILVKWSANAGTGDRKTEVDNLDYAIAMLDQFIEKAEEAYSKEIKLYKSCGFLIGAFVAAVLL